MFLWFIYVCQVLLYCTMLLYVSLNTLTEHGGSITYVLSSKIIINKFKRNACSSCSQFILTWLLTSVLSLFLIGRKYVMTISGQGSNVQSGHKQDIHHNFLYSLLTDYPCSGRHLRIIDHKNLFEEFFLRIKIILFLTNVSQNNAID